DSVPASGQLAAALRLPLPPGSVPPRIVRRTPHVFGAGLKDQLGVERHTDGSDANAFTFKRKGTVPSLRAFTIGALEGELGVQALEKVAAAHGVTLESAAALDPDADGVASELTVGDVTALVTFQATLPTPTRLPLLGSLLPGETFGPDLTLPGEQLFRAPI